jgi:hypothetical protein
MKPTSDEARQVFRQFAWHLAGKLVQPRPAGPAGTTRRPGKAARR